MGKLVPPEILMVISCAAVFTVAQKTQNGKMLNLRFKQQWLRRVITSVM
jgi:hypothetical protein